MKTQLFLYSFLMFCFVAITSHAQNRTYTIKGVVSDSITNKPLLGVYIVNGNAGEQTNKKGEYTIKNAPAGEVVLTTMYYSTFHQQTKVIDLQSDTTINFSLRDNLMLDEVVVTGTRTERRLSDTPILTTVINDQSIRKAASTTVLESLMDNVPGIIGSQNAMGANLRIKGLSSRYILFLVDGERMVSEGASGNINLNQIDVNNIKKIEMINGAASALYGSNAVGAVINFITKEPQHKFEAGTSIVGETNNTLRFGANVGMNHKKVQSNVSGFRHSSNGFDMGGGNSASPYADYGANLKVKYKPIERVDVTLTGRYFSHETFNPENITMNPIHSFTQNLNVGASGGVKSLDKRNDLRISFNFNKYFNFNILEKLNDEKDKTDDASYVSTRVFNSFAPNKKWEIVGGLEHNHERNFSTTTLGEDQTTKTIDDANIFAQAEYELINNLDIVAGTRYTYNSQFGSAMTPKLSLMYELSGFKFRGGIGSAFRAPSIKELYYDFDHQGMFWIVGNPGLEAEKGVYSSLSVEYTKNLFNASVSSYYNDINNKITQFDVKTNNRLEKHYKNISSATIKGFDVNVSQILFRKLTVKANYSFCDAKDNSTDLQLESNVKHSGTVSAMWDGKIANSPFSLQMSGTLNSPRLYNTITTNDNGEDLIERSESKRYSIWKVALVKPIRINKHTIELSGKVDNLFGFKADTYINSGRQYLVGISYSFK